MLYEFKDLIAQEGKDIIQDLKINIKPSDRLARVKCCLILWEGNEDLDLALDYRYPEVKFPNCIFSIKGLENIRKLYFQLDVSLNMLTRVWHVKGIIEERQFEKSLKSPFELLGLVKELLKIRRRFK